MKRARTRTILAIVLVPLCGLLIIALVGPGSVAERMVPPAVPEDPIVSSTPLIDTTWLTQEENEFLVVVRPLMAQLVGEVRALTELGENKSRNLLQLTVRANRVRSLGNELDGYLQENPVPESLRPAIAQYHEGARQVHLALDEAGEGYVSFDWERVANSTETMRVGRDLLVGALDMQPDDNSTPT